VIAKRAVGWFSLAMTLALVVGCQASDRQRRERAHEQRLAGMPYRFELPPGWQGRPRHVSISRATAGGGGPFGANASCIPAEIFALERDQYCVGPVDGGSRNYTLVSTWPAPAGVDQLSDADLPTPFTRQYEEVTGSAVEDVQTVHLAGRRAVVFTSEGAHAEDPHAHFYLTIASPLIVQIYCEYGGWPDQQQMILNGCEEIVRTLEIKP
jgi:hypothetical protein